MKTYSVYLLKDTVGKIVYVGMTSLTLKERLKCHWYSKKGNWYLRKDLTIHLIDTFNTKQEALDKEAILKFQLGFRNEIITDVQYNSKMGGSVSGKINGSINGKANFKNKIGMFDPKNKEKLEEGRKKAGKMNVESGHIERIRIKAHELIKKPVLVYTTNGVFIAEYPSQAEAGRQMNIHYQSINKCVKGVNKTAGGYVFKNK